MDPRQPVTHRRGHAVADAVLDATMSLLAEHGYDFTIDDVAGLAGVHKTTIYRRWATKPQLVAAAMHRVAGSDVVPSASDDPLTDLDRLAVQVARALRRPAEANALRAALSAAGADAELRAAAGDFLTARYAVALDLIRHAQARELIAPEHDPVLIWQSIVNPMHLNAVLGGALDDDTAHALVRLVLGGARSRPDGPARS